MREEIGRYRCLGASGQEYVVIEYQNMVPTEGSGGSQYRLGTKELELENGRRVDFIDADLFEIASTEEILRTIHTR